MAGVSLKPGCQTGSSKVGKYYDLHQTSIYMLCQTSFFPVKEKKQWNNAASVNIKSWNIFLSRQLPSCRLHHFPCHSPRKAQCFLLKRACTYMMYRLGHVGFTFAACLRECQPWSQLHALCWNRVQWDS